MYCVKCRIKKDAENLQRVSVKKSKKAPKGMWKEHKHG